MDFQDRFRNRSSLLSKNGLHSILNAPGRPIRKSNTSESTSFFVPNIHNVSTDSITQRGAPVNPFNTSSENPGYIASSRPALSHHQTPLGKARKNIMPQSFFGPVQSKWFSNVGRYAEDNNETKLLESSTHRIHTLKTEKDTETSYSRYKVSRPNEKSVNISKGRKEGDSRIGLGDYSHSQGLERIRTDKSYDDNEKIRGLDHIMKKSLRKTGLRGISLELVSSKKLAELGQPSTVRMKEYIAQGGYFENKQILPQLEKVKHLASFREKPHQSGGYLMDYFNNADTRIEQKRSGTRIIKTRSCDKGQKTMEKEQSEIKKAINKEEKKENPNKLRKGLNVPIMERDISAESHKAAKRVSFRESAEVITNKTFKKK